MKIFWKFFSISLLVIALLLIIGSAVFNWNHIDRHPTVEELRNRMQNDNPPQMQEIPVAIRLSGNFLSSLLTGFLTLFLLPNRIANITRKLKPGKKSLKIFLTGLLTGIVFLAIASGSFLSFITFPLFFILILLLFLMVWLGYVAISLQVGVNLQHKSGWFSTSPLLAFGVGHLLFFALLQVPVLNIVTIFVLSSLGAGAVIATRLGSTQRWSLQALKEGSL